MVKWLDRLQRRSRAVGFAVAVVYKHIDDQGGYLAALIAYYAFVSLFPLLLLFTTVLAVVLAGHPDLHQQIVHSAMSQLPVIGPQLGQPRQLGGGAIAVVIGVAGAVYGGLGVGQAVQHALDTIWAVPRHRRPDPVRSRLRTLVFLVVFGTAMIVTTVLSAAGHVSGTWGLLPKAGAALAALAINTLVLMLVFRFGTAHRLSFSQIVPGALTAAVVWQVLQWFGAAYVARVVASSTATNSIFALVLGLLAFLYLVAMTLVLCAQINAVRANRLYPRSLLTPFTDDVQLTIADRKTYTGQAKAQQAKGFEDIAVTFDPPGGG